MSSEASAIDRHSEDLKNWPSKQLKSRRRQLIQRLDQIDDMNRGDRNAKRVRKDLNCQLIAINFLLRNRPYEHNEPESQDILLPPGHPMGLRISKLVNCATLPLDGEKRNMSKELTTEEKVLDGMQLGSFVTVTVGNYHGHMNMLRVPIATPIEEGDYVVFVEGHKGDINVRNHGTLDEHILNFGEVTEVHKAPNPEARNWIIAKLDMTAYEAHREKEKDALDKLRGLEQQKQRVIAVDHYADSLPEDGKSMFEDLLGSFGATSAPQLEESKDDSVVDA